MMAQLQSLACLTFGLTLLAVIYGSHCALICKEDNSDQPAQQSVHQSPKTKATGSGSSKWKSYGNSHSMSSVHRSQVSRWPSTRTVTVPVHSVSSSVPAESQRREHIIIPVGVSHYRPVQYVDSFEHKPLPMSYFDKLLASAKSKWQSTSTTVKPPTGTSSTSTDGTANNTVAASSDINEVKVISAMGESSSSRTQHSSAPTHPPRFIELESSYVPLTIRFPSRATKLNILPGDNDLVGQDSTRHDSFGRRESIDSNSRSVDLDSRVIFGEEKREEPIVLKQGVKSQIPNNMQRIIKCIFPDFHFDGEDKVQSVC